MLEIAERVDAWMVASIMGVMVICAMKWSGGDSELSMLSIGSLACSNRG